MFLASSWSYYETTKDSNRKETASLVKTIKCKVVANTDNDSWIWWPDYNTYSLYTRESDLKKWGRIVVWSNAYRVEAKQHFKWIFKEYSRYIVTIATNENRL